MNGANCNSRLSNSTAPLGHARSAKGDRSVERKTFLPMRLIPAFSWLFLASNLVLASASSVANADERACDEVIRNPEKADFPPYQVGDTVFKVPFARSSWFSSGPTKVNGIGVLFYSLDEQRFLSRGKDRDKLTCRGWCDQLDITLNVSHRQNNVMYRIDATDKLSRQIPVADELMLLRFQSLQNKKITSYWKLYPEMRAELRCGRTEVASPSCAWNFDFSPWVEARVSFGRKYLPDAEKILDSVTNILHCLKEGS